MFCSKCGSPNENSAKFCSSCGDSLNEYSKTAASSQLEADTSHNKEEFYMAAVGPKNQSYYLSQFSRFDKNNAAGASWHWPAFFVTFYWFLYRKMWRNALIYFFLPYLILFVMAIAAAAAGDSGGNFFSIGYILYFVAWLLLPPIYANALYYRHCKNKIGEASDSAQDPQRQLGKLSEKGGTSNVILIIVLIFAFFSTVGILAAIAIPAYQDYITRAHVAEAASLGDNAADSVANYYYQYQDIPNSLEQAGFSLPRAPSVKELGVNSENGTVTITMAAAPISGKSFVLVPSLDSNKQIIWACMSVDIQNKYLPQRCKQQ